MKTYLRALSSAETTVKARGRSIMTLIMAVVMSLFAIFMAFQVKNGITGTFKLLSETHDVQSRITAITSGIVDAQSSIRGYIITQDKSYLEPYERAKTAMPKLVDEITAIAASDSAIDRQTKEFAGLATQTLGFFVSSVETAIKDGVDAPATKAAMDERQRRTEVLRASSAYVLNNLQAQQTEQSTGIDKASSLLVAAVAVLVIGLGLIAASQARELVVQDVQHVRTNKEASETIATLSDTVNRSRAETEGLNRQLGIALRSAKVQVFGITRTGRVEWMSNSKTSLAADRQLPFNLFDVVAEADRDTLAMALASKDMPDISIRVARGEDSPRYYKLNFVEDDASHSQSLLGSAVDITDLKLREENSFWLMRELSHRSKNLLAIVQSIARQTASATNSVVDFQKRFSERLSGLASAHDLLVKTSYSGADLRALILSQLGAQAIYVGERIHLSGPDVAVRHEAAQNIAMAMQELISNAALHGALSTASGQVTLEWHLGALQGEPALVLSWRESGGLAPKTDAKSGFGTSLITKNLPRSLDGEVTLTHTSQGTECEMVFPMRRLTPEAILPQVKLS